LKHYLLLFLLFKFGIFSYAQNINLEITGTSLLETKLIDSITYVSNHQNAKSIGEEIEKTTQKLAQIGFLENKIINTTKINDSSFYAKLDLGERVKSVHIYLGTIPSLKKLLFPNNYNDTLVIPYTKTDAFFKHSLKTLDENGYAFAKLNLSKVQKKGKILFAVLKFEAGNQRKLNRIVIKPENNDFPKGHKAQINRQYKNKIFTQDLVSQIHDDFEKYRFANQTKYPEILFTNDTTNVYVYVEKIKANTFDGFIGFNNNDQQKLTFNGYLDVTLQNTLKVGEQFSLYWKSDGNKQKTFKTALELPYIFRSPIGLRGQLYIFKQDSTFQNTKTALDLSYYLNYTNRIYLGYQSTISSDIQNTNNSLINDYKNSYLTFELAYSKLDQQSSLFLNKSELNIKTGIGKRETNNLTDDSVQNQQFYIDLFAMHTFYLNGKNSINIRSQNYYLKSSNYITNELFRFGGINSMRGFVENSLQANLMTAVLAEYRYLASPSLYFYSITDYSIFTDSTIKTESSTKTKLLGVGLGIGIKTKNGLLKISLATGSTNDRKIEISNTIVHLSYGIKF
jgi:hypothetical protein